MAITTNIDSFAAPHGKKEGGGGGTTIIMSNQNNSSIPANINVNTINATTGDIQNLTGRSLTFNDGSFIYLVSENGTIAKLNGNELKYENGVISNLTSDSIETGKLKTTDLEATNATIDNIISKNITTEYLTVTKQAHFFELVIDKIKAVGGQIILTPASCIADYVIPDPDHNTPLYYDVYFRATDEVNREIINYWQVDDQAICQNFNNATQGHNYNVSNKYYWRLVTGILEDAYINFRTGQKLPYDTTEAHDYTSANIWNICLGSYDVNTGDHIDYKTDFDDDPNYPVDPGTEGYTKRALLNNVDIAPMELNHIPMAGWTSKTVAEDPMIGEMKTYNTIFGIQITPKENSNITGAILNKIELSTAEETRLNIGVYYVDDSSQYFPAPLEKTDHYVYNLNANTSIEAIIITNSDEPDWHLCHGIRLGNDNTNPDDLQVDVSYNPYSAVTPSIPEVGDNIIQLGYRYHKYDPQSPDPEIRAKYDVKRASAIIIASYHTPDTDVKPPSYAQYQNITKFDLSSYRGTYMDATGTYIKGKLVTTSGNEIDITDDGLDVSTSYYRLICNENPITKPATSKTISFTVFYVDNGVGVEMTAAQLSGWTLRGYTTDSSNQNHSFNVNPVTNQNYFNVTINSTDISIEAQLYDNSTPAVLKDTYVGSIINLEDVKDGKDGKYDQWAYKTSTAANIGARPSSGSTYPPSGWQSTPQSISNADEHIWMITRTVDPNAVNKWGSWSWPAVRIDGEQGQAGVDGDLIEFIYTQNNTGTAPSAPPTNGTYPRDWPNNGTTDHQTDSNGVTWWDNPQGVSVNMKYEYISSREYDGVNHVWSNYSIPALWSKYGEKGMDGDGYEYIYRLSENDQFTNPNSISMGEIGPQGVANGTERDKTKDDWVPNGWSDDPQGVSSAYGKKQEYVSTRKKTGGQQWGAFSEPALWAQYVPEGVQGPQGPQGNPGIPGGTGPQGPTGPQGINGKDGEYYALVPLREEFAVKLNAEQVGTNAYQNIAGVLYTDVIYAIAHIVGDTITYLNASELANWRLRISSDNTSGYYVQNSTTKALALDTKNGYTYDALRYQIDNYLSFVRDNGDPNYLNYYYLHANNHTAYMPTRLNIALEYHYSNEDAAWALKDSATVNLEFKPSHIFSVTETALNSIYQGLSGDTNSSWSATGFSAIKQTWDQINLGVNNIRSLENGLQLVNTDTEQYALYKTESSNTPSAPSGNVSATNGINQWTNDLTLSPDDTYKKEWISTRTRSYSVSTGVGAYGTWSSWSAPKLYWVWGESRSTTINSAQLNIEADKIESNVKSSIKTGGTNLIMNGAFKKDLEFWNENGSDTGVTRGITTDDAGYKWAYIKAPSNSQYTGYNQSRYSNNKIIIKSGKTYTLTFRAYAVLDPEQVGATPELSTIFHWGNHILTDAYRQEHNLGIPQIGKKYQLSTSPQSYTWSFTIPDNLFNTGVGAEWFTFIFNDENGQNIKMYITDITFVEGDTPQYWSPAPEEEEEYTESSITQTANNIKLEVKNGLNSTGINIDQHTITLNADKTTINGQLEVNSNNDGIKVSSTRQQGNDTITTYGYLTGGPIDSFSTWNGKACNRQNAISRLGADGYEYISATASGRKIYMGDEGIRFDSLNTAIQLSDDHLNKYVKGTYNDWSGVTREFEYASGYKYKPIEYKGIRVLHVNNHGIYLNSASGTQLADVTRNYTLSIYDEMIIVNGESSCILILPDLNYESTGKIITIRNNSAKAIRLDSTRGFYTTCWSDNHVLYNNDSSDDYASCTHMYIRAYGCTQLVYNYNSSNTMIGWHEITNGWNNTYRSDTARSVSDMDTHTPTGW